MRRRGALASMLSNGFNAKLRCPAARGRCWELPGVRVRVRVRRAASTILVRRAFAFSQVFMGEWDGGWRAEINVEPTRSEWPGLSAS
jgi:hypothetical protein